MSGTTAKDKVKVVMLGKYSAGKTCLIDRLVHERFLGPTSATVGAAFNAFDVAIDPRGSKKLTLGIWDTAGSDRFEALTKMYYKDALAALVCFDLTDADSYERAKTWITRVSESEPNCILVLVGTKLDLVLAGQPRGATAAATKKHAKAVGATYFECSAKLGDDAANGCKIAEPFEFVAQEIVRRKAAGGGNGGHGDDDDAASAALAVTMPAAQFAASEERA